MQTISLKNTRISHERKNRVTQDPAVVQRSMYVSGLAWSTTDTGKKLIVCIVKFPSPTFNPIINYPTTDLWNHFAQIAPVNSAIVLRKTRGGKSFSLG